MTSARLPPTTRRDVLLEPQGMRGGIEGRPDRIHGSSEVDPTGDLKRIDGPTGATRKVCPGAPHGLAQTRQDEFSAGLPAFIRS